MRTCRSTSRGELAAEDVEILGLVGAARCVLGQSSTTRSRSSTRPRSPRSVASRAEVDQAQPRARTTAAWSTCAPCSATAPSSTSSGTLTGLQQVEKIVNINGRNFDLRAEGLNLVVHYADQPGALGKIGTLLGNAGIDIQAAALSQDAEGEGATILLRVDREVAERGAGRDLDRVGATKIELVNLAVIPTVRRVTTPFRGTRTARWK